MQAYVPTRVFDKISPLSIDRPEKVNALKTEFDPYNLPSVIITPPPETLKIELQCPSAEESPERILSYTRILKRCAVWLRFSLAFLCLSSLLSY
jgi:hypothetical protein